MHGTFIWHELMTPDPAAAKAFYGALLGWEPTDMVMEGFTYTTFAVPGFPSGVTGMMALGDEMKEQGIPPNWTGYIAVDDVDKTAAEFERDGGAIHRAPEDIPGIGRFAVVADPQGAVVCLMTPKMPDGETGSWPTPGSTGTVGWNELMAGDWASVWDFYAARFGWDKGHGRRHGRHGYLPDLQARRSWHRRHDDQAPGNADGLLGLLLHRAGHRFGDRQGEVARWRDPDGPHQVPGGSWIAACQDPQGAYFNLTSGTR